jgi:hypothetical protein
MMKKYKFIEPGENDEVIETILTEDQIIEEYWEFWSRKMTEKYGSDHEFITTENCIEDWCVSHWAVEVK